MKVHFNPIEKKIELLLEKMLKLQKELIKIEVKDQISTENIKRALLHIKNVK